MTDIGNRRFLTRFTYRAPKLHGMIAALLCLQAFTSSETPAPVQNILERFAAAKPGKDKLGFFTLDWAMNLTEAKQRAAKEKRPILLILNTNITAGTNFFSGHT